MRVLRHEMPMHLREMNRRFARLLTLALACPLAAVAGGCLINAEGERVVRNNEARRTVQFESDTGLEQFQQTVRMRGSWASRYQGESSFGIPFIIGVEQRRVISENAFYNDQVSAADVNGDGVLSDAEVRAYSGPY